MVDQLDKSNHRGPIWLNKDKIAGSCLYFHIARYIYVFNIFVYVYICMFMSVEKLSRSYMFIVCTLSYYK